MAESKEHIQVGSKRVLGVFALTMMSIAAIFSIRNSTISAVYGLSSVSYYLLAAFLFLLPTSVICAQLGKNIPEAGGLYAWVKNILGKRAGFVAIWLEWTNCVVAFPLIIAFVIFTIIFPIAPHVAQNKFFEFGFMIAVFWGISYINFFGIKATKWFSNFGVIAGTIFPVALIFGLALVWFFSGKPNHLVGNGQSLIPAFHLHNLAFLNAMINGFSGIQIMAFHSRETKNPTRNYPISVAITGFAILAMCLATTLSIAMVLPLKSSELISGLIQAYATFFDAFHLGWLIPYLAVLIALGIIVELNAWLIGPSKGLLEASENLPKIFSKRNKHNVPVGILTIQAIIGSILGIAYLLMPSVNSGFWLLSDLTGLFTLLMWLFIFASSIALPFVLRKSDKLVSFKQILLWAIALIGMLTCATIFIASFIPPEMIVKENAILRYELFLIGGIVIFAIMPFGLKKLAIYRNNNNSITTSAETYSPE